MEKQDIIQVFQQEFGRLLSPMEKEIIDDWKKDGISEETIIKGLKQSVFNGALSFRYISKILQSWKAENQETTNNIDLSFLD